MTRSELANIVRPILIELQPCTTEVICHALVANHGIDLEVADLESFLRWLAGEGVRYSDEGTWRVTSDSDGVTATQSFSASAVPDQANVGPAPQLRSPSATHLRTIERLRSGLPPVEAIEELSIDHGGSISTIRQLLARTSDNGRWVMVRGQYGTGKTHFLQLFRSLALDSNYTCCYLCADNGACALNHPLRFVPSLLATMEIPRRPGVAYADLLRNLLETVNGRQWLRAALEKWRVRGRQPLAAAIERLEQIMAQMTGPEEMADPIIVTQIIELIHGRSVSTCSSTPETREVAYNLLLLANDVVKHAGTDGIALLVDEVESVFTKLPTITSRAGAMRVLSALCEADRLAPIITAVAITPDAYEMLRHEMSLYDPTRCHPNFEPMSRFRGNIAKGVHFSVDCKAPKGTDLRSILEKVREFYLRGYPCMALGTTARLDEWRRLSKALQTTNTTPRLIIRRAIDFLDTQRYQAFDGEENSKTASPQLS